MTRAERVESQAIRDMLICFIPTLKCQHRDHELSIACLIYFKLGPFAKTLCKDLFTYLHKCTLLKISPLPIAFMIQLAASQTGLELKHILATLFDL